MKRFRFKVAFSLWHNVHYGRNVTAITRMLRPQWKC